MKILAPAKINLFLEVTGRRKDGYHNIVSLMQTVGLYDRIILKPRKSGITLNCDSKELRNIKTNLAYKAAILLKNELKYTGGADIYLEKHIPIGAGLGGGSSDAAAVLKGLLKLWKRGLPENRLLALAGTLGADVPFFVSGGTAVARGIGEKLINVRDLRPCLILLVNPGFGVATKQVYNNLRFPLTKKQKINKILRLLKGKKTPQEWGKSMFNRLEEAVLPEYPEIVRIKQVFKQHGCDSLMSGSGSSVFGIVRTKTIAESIRPDLKRSGWKSWLVRTIA